MARHLKGEPEFNVVHTKADIIRALNYYGEMAADDDIREWAENWCAAHGIDVTLKHRTVGELKSYACFWRMAERGLIMDDAEIDRINNAFRSLGAKSATKAPEKPKTVRKTGASGSQVLADLGAYLDEVAEGKITSARAPTLARTGKDVAELRLACERGLAALAGEKEYYAPSVWAALKGAYRGILKSLEGYETKLKTERARVATKRAKSPVITAKDVRYLKEYQGVRSVTPEKIIGAKKVYVFDADARKLKVFIATGDGFTFTGTTLKNYDAEKSKCKTVRKPETLMKTQMGMAALNTHFAEIKAVESSVNGRFNENTIILGYN